MNGNARFALAFAPSRAHTCVAWPAQVAVMDDVVLRRAGGRQLGAEGAEGDHNAVSNACSNACTRSDRVPIGGGLWNVLQPQNCDTS